MRVYCLVVMSSAAVSSISVKALEPSNSIIPLTTNHDATESVISVLLNRSLTADEASDDEARGKSIGEVFRIETLAKSISQLADVKDEVDTNILPILQRLTTAKQMDGVAESYMNGAKAATSESELACALMNSYGDKTMAQALVLAIAHLESVEATAARIVQSTMLAHWKEHKRTPEHILGWLKDYNMIEDSDLFTLAVMKLLSRLDPNHNSDRLHEALFDHFDKKIYRFNSALYKAWANPRADREAIRDCRAWMQEQNKKLKHERILNAFMTRSSH